MEAVGYVAACRVGEGHANATTMGAGGVGGEGIGRAGLGRLGARWGLLAGTWFVGQGTQQMN